MWENKEFKVKLEENAIRDFEKIMLTSGECSIFMPMGFISENGCEYGRYNCSGFAPLSGYRVERTEDALYILENVLLILGSGVFYRSVEGEGDGGDGILQQRHGTDKDSIYPASGRGGQHAKEPGGVHWSAQAVPEGRQRSLSCGSR